MNNTQKLKEKLKNRETVVMANTIVMTSPLMLGCFRNADCVLLDMEHGIYNPENLIGMFMQCRSMDLPSIVRVQDSVYHCVAKAIDLGGDGIMLPRTETLEQLKTAVGALRFYPKGRTGFGGWGILKPGETFADFQQGRIFLPQIESAEGCDLIPQMMDAYGDEIDGFIVGPNDYSIRMGVPRELDNPIMMKEYEKFFRYCESYKLSCGIFAADDYHVKLYKSMGANIFWIGDDYTYMREGFESHRAAVFEE